MFAGRKLLIVTKHGKETVLAPILEKALNVVCVTNTTFDTDCLGTFSGEIERTEDPITTAKSKCYQALKNSEFDLAVSSEGSFGMHPSLYFIPADDEFLVFIDTKNQLEIVAREISTVTNFSGKEVHSISELIEFAQNAGSPSHALILKDKETSFTKITKGIHDLEELTSVFSELQHEFGSAFVETDMRAMHNPMRMKVIASCAEKLVKKLLSLCPNCQTPGFGITTANEGLPCDACGAPTRSIISHNYCCEKCGFLEIVKYPNKKTTEEAMYCDICNP